MASEVAEALKQIRACEEEARRIVSEARERAAKIVKDAEALKERARKNEEEAIEAVLEVLFGFKK